MAYSIGGYEYEADAITDGVLHYYPMFSHSTDFSTTPDYIAGYDLLVGNSNPQNCFSDESFVGTAFNTVANGTSTNHNWLQTYPDLSSTPTYPDWSVSLWVKVTNPTPTGSNHMVFLNTSISSGVKIYISYTTGEITAIDSVGNTLSSGVTPITNGIYHIVVTCNGTTPLTSLYVNNAAPVTVADAVDLDLYTVNFIVGNDAANNTDTQYSEAIIDELVFFDREITAAEVSNLYNSGTPTEFIKYLQSGRVLLETTMGFADAGDWAFFVDVIEQLGLQDNSPGFLVAALTFLADAADQLGISDSTPDDPGIVFLPIVEDGVNLVDTFSVSAPMSAVASDGVNFVTAFNVSGENYVGVVMNTQNQAVTEYGNFDFNSMAYLGNNQYFGAKSDGIYELDGSDDAGSQIDAFLSTHLMDFGEQEFKRVERAYLGFRNDGPMVLKTIVRDDATGERKEYWYDLTQTSEAARIERIKVGKGLKSHLWQFELHSNEGADFELDSLEFVPIVLSRRV